MKKCYDVCIVHGDLLENYSSIRKVHRLPSRTSSKGSHAPPPLFFTKGLKINEYGRVLDGVAAGCQYVGQQDGARAHNAMAAQDWCLLSHEAFVYLAAQTVAH
jgi:hypothetical protein